ncbi:GntR family transcriptional regulator [Brachybacterium sp. ACRRE]|uniref:GntR family transcriptional regulator n=1 Tax=Brachybacterium sp. ACRRE TaxID=2918184 RepID=UPI001EF3AE21|nr:GntR family transcriptional regulator [Brachybacterium sp. ACRRE]MCG7310720.1 GntR family transcriptional regulator [Brachybacterium sp. ACRRE]
MLHPESVRSRVTGEIRTAIRSLHFAPGQRLVERELVETYGASRATVREALQALASEGLVTMVPQRGALVAKPSPDDAQDMYEIRSMLEGMLVRKFCERASQSQKWRLRVAVAEFGETVEAGAPVSEVITVKDRFYEVLLEGANSTVLRQTIGSVHARVAALRATSLTSPGRGPLSVEELSAVADAAIVGDVEAAVAANTHHLKMAAGAARIGEG